jgi:hypothetical protein
VSKVITQQEAGSQHGESPATSRNSTVFVPLQTFVLFLLSAYEVNAVHIRRLCSRSRRSDQAVFLMYRVYSVNIDNILYGYVECVILCKGDGFRLTICMCC